MSSIQELFQQAELAEAAYADFIDPLTGVVFVDLEKINKIPTGSGLAIQHFDF